MSACRSCGSQTAMGCQCAVADSDQIGWTGDGSPPSPYVATVGAGAIGTRELENLSVTTEKYADESVTADKLAAGAVMAPRLAAVDLADETLTATGGWQAWGSTITVGDPGFAGTLWGIATGSVTIGAGTDGLANQAAFRVAVSTDGGATWAAGSQTGAEVLEADGSRVACLSAQTTLAVAAGQNVLARAEIFKTSASTDLTFIDGVVTALLVAAA